MRPTCQLRLSLAVALSVFPGCAPEPGSSSAPMTAERSAAAGAPPAAPDAPAAAAAAAGGGPDGRLSLDEARLYLVGLINRDRASGGLRPVTLDPGPATAAAQSHADDMAAHGYLGHWGSDGSVPGVALHRRRRRGDGPRERALLHGRGRRAGSIPRRGSIRGSSTRPRPCSSTRYRRTTVTGRTSSAPGTITSASASPSRRRRRERLPGRASPRSWSPTTAATPRSPRAPGSAPPCTSRARFTARPPSPAWAWRAPSCPPLWSIHEANSRRSYPVPSPYVTYWPHGFRTPKEVQVANGHFSIDVPALPTAAWPGLLRGEHLGPLSRDERSADRLAPQHRRHPLTMAVALT